MWAVSWLIRKKIHRFFCPDAVKPERPEHPASAPCTAWPGWRSRLGSTSAPARETGGSGELLSGPGPAPPPAQPYHLYPALQFTRVLARAGWASRGASRSTGSRTVLTRRSGWSGQAAARNSGRRQSVLAGSTAAQLRHSRQL